MPCFSVVNCPVLPFIALSRCFFTHRVSVWFFGCYPVGFLLVLMVCGVQWGKIAKNGCYCSLNIHPHLRLPSRVEQQTLRALGSLFSQYPPLLCLLVVLPCWQCHDPGSSLLVDTGVKSTFRFMNWVVGHGGNLESDIRGMLLTSDQRKHLGEIQKEVTGSITSPVFFDTVTVTWCTHTLQLRILM